MNGYPSGNTVVTSTVYASRGTAQPSIQRGDARESHRGRTGKPRER